MKRLQLSPVTLLAVGFLVVSCSNDATVGSPGAAGTNGGGGTTGSSGSSGTTGTSGTTGAGGNSDVPFTPHPYSRRRSHTSNVR